MVLAAAATVPGVAAHADSRHTDGVRFDLNAVTLDGGEQVTSVTIDTSTLGPVDPASLTTGTFSVRARATSPIPAGDGLPGYDLDRPVTAAWLAGDGDIVLDLSHGESQSGARTVDFHEGSGRNVRLQLDYTITQHAPIVLRDGRPVTIADFTQGGVRNPEVDVFSHHVSASGMNYRLYSTPSSGRRPLIVWLHGGGEGGSLPDDYYDNETPLRGNRGALGFATGAAQRIFGGAHVVAPQCASAWVLDGPAFVPLVEEIVREVSRDWAVDPGRVYVAGCSSGGYLGIKLTTVYPTLFAASVPICGVVVPWEPGGQPLVPDADLAAISTPTWLVAARDDTAVDPLANTVHAHELIPGSVLTLYDQVVWNGHQFPGHYSWIYVARNDPSNDGTSVWQWMADFSRPAP
ncbi:hypothetical protein GCM10027436_50730 [Actinophytocola sediminis]